MNTTDSLIIAGFIVVMVVAYKLFSLITTFQIDRSARRITKRILSDVQDGKTAKKTLENAVNGIIEVTENGFVVKDKSGEPLKTVIWNQVTHIFAFKKDLGTTDLVCLGWKLEGTEQGLEVHEEMSGFAKLNQAMLGNYRSIPETWAMDIYFPAFETNFTLLWPKSGQHENQAISNRADGDKTEKNNG